jgi:tripartite ATP-independent transporter DctM subunit
MHETATSVEGTDPLRGMAADRAAIPSALRHAATALDRALEALLAVALLGELGIVASNVLYRWVSGLSFVWTLEGAELPLSIIAFLGGALAYRRGEHATIAAVVRTFPPSLQRVTAAVVEWLVLAIVGTTGVSAIPLMRSQWEQRTPILDIRTCWFVLPLFLSMGVLAVTAFARLRRQPRGTVLGTGVVLAGVIMALVLAYPLWQPAVAGQGAILCTLAVFFIPVLLGMPVGFALLLGTLTFIATSGRASFVALAHTTASGVNNFVLLALPFFIFAGILMNRGGISRRLVRLVEACVGHIRGGLFQVMVVSMYIVSGLSGSKAADVAAVGSVMRDMLRREDYSLDEATAVLSAAAVMGETVPPSLAMLVLGSVTTVSMGALFLAGLIPAVVVGICLMLLIYCRARGAGGRRLPRATGHELWQAVLGGLLPLGMPLLLLGGIIFGVATPTEVSAFAVLYGVVLASWVYRELGFRGFVESVIDCASVSGMVLFILGAATSFAWSLTVAQLPQRLVALLAHVQQSQAVFLIASMLLLIVAGSVLEGLPALLILAPLLMPMASQVGVHPLHYGIILVLAMGFGTFMPPIGVGFYISCAVCETRLESAGRAMIPYLIVLWVGLLIVALVPWFTLYLPLTLHLG